MIAPQPWAALLLVWLGNCGFWLFCFNRINATGLPRYWTKRIEKLCMLLCFVIPAAIALVDSSALLYWLGQSTRWWPADASWSFQVWAGGSLLSLVVLGIPWLESRRWMFPPDHLQQLESQRWRIPQLTHAPSAADRLTGLLERVPGNQIDQLEVTRKELRLPRSISGIDGFTIGHISDLHFTGQLTLPHYHAVIDRFLALKPDLIVITGDIIDYAKCLSWVEPLLGRLVAPYGCTYVLGNHDRRLRDIAPLTDILQQLGHFDLGVQDQRLELDRGATIWLTGNERPWFERHAGPAMMPASTDDTVLRLGLSHSPDQIVWAQQHRLDLLLAGHTHGGQVRFPLVGPIVSPSRYGSRFASGVFYLPPTLMHVSRGIAGTHPLRLWCSPEVSLLTLRG